MKTATCVYQSWKHPRNKGLYKKLFVVKKWDLLLDSQYKEVVILKIITFGSLTSIWPKLYIYILMWSLTLHLSLKNVYSFYKNKGHWIIANMSRKPVFKNNYFGIVVKIVQKVHIYCLHCSPIVNLLCFHGTFVKTRKPTLVYYC